MCTCNHIKHVPRSAIYDRRATAPQSLIQAEAHLAHGLLSAMTKHSLSHHEVEAGRNISSLRGLAVASMKTTPLWKTAPRSLVEVDRRFRGTYCLHYQEVSTSETSVYFYETARRNPRRLSSSEVTSYAVAQRREMAHTNTSGPTAGRRRLTGIMCRHDTQTETVKCRRLRCQCLTNG
jgi:hypothetical protein